MRFGPVLLVLICLIFAGASSAHAQKRVALVIGNSAYQHTSKLTNPRNDATDMAAALKRHGFQVIEGLDLGKAAFDRIMRDFALALKGSDAGVFFYAGHGMQVAGQNYLVPIDAKAEGAEALEFEMVRLDVVHRIMERQTSTNILFLDACRDNPLARNLARSMGTRSSEIARGLAAVESGVGTLISFSTQPGNVALDGTGRNSPFAGALVRRISTSNDDLSALLIDVRNDVRKDTYNKQVPWEHSALTGRFYFGTPPLNLNEEIAILKGQLSELEAELKRQEQKGLGNAKEMAALKQELAKSRDELKRREEGQNPQAPGGSQSTTQTAMLPPSAGSKDSATYSPTPLVGGQLVREIKKELKRVGCYGGPIDEKWSSATKTSSQNFAKYAKLPSGPAEPHIDLLNAIGGQTGRVCPLECNSRQMEKDGQCIAKTCPSGLTLGLDGVCEKPKEREKAGNEKGDRSKASGSPGNAELGDPLREAERIWPSGTLHKGQTVTATARNGRKITCTAGNLGPNFVPRKCFWN